MVHVHQTDTLYLNGVEFVMPGNLTVIGNRENQLKKIAEHYSLLNFYCSTRITLISSIFNF